MESILARALESTLKYWLRSFSRDQFKLQGRTVQLSNLDIDGDALHSSVGLPPALNVARAKVGKLVIVLPSVSNVQIEPVVVQIDRLDLVLEENSDPKSCSSSSCSQSNASGGKSSGYGFADKIADGMTLEVQTVNLMLETRGGARSEGGSTWTPPMASITIRNLLLYTTNENWEVVNLKEARDFSTNKQFIYAFKKLEWETLSIDLLPHPDMFLDARLSHAQGASKRDADGAKRVFFGGERFLEGISGQAYITVKRTGINDPLGLEVRLHITEAVCPAFSEPGLRALLRFLTGLYVCLNRGDVDPKSLQQSTEAAGCSLVSVIVDHIFFCVRDAEFRLDLLMQSLHLSRSSIFDGENSQNLTEITIGGFFLRDTFSRPPCALIQPSMHVISEGSNTIPDFARNFCPPIYPLGGQQWQPNKGVPFISIHSLQVKPSPSPPVIASETVVHCQPLMIHLQEESCLRLSSLLADGIVVSPGVVLPDFSIKSLKFSLKELDLTVPLSSKMLTTTPAESACTSDKSSFAGARLHIENLFLFESPFLNLTLLGLEKDPACFCFWKNQPVDAGQKKWTAGASYLGLSLETVDDIAGLQSSFDWPLRWKCVEVRDACIEVAMATPDGSPLTSVPPPGGVVRVGIACEQYLSNTSVEQLFFVLELYAYLGNVSEKIAIAGKSSRLQPMKRSESWSDNLMSKFPSDTAIRLVVRYLRLRFLEDSCKTIEGRPLVQFVGEDLCIRVSHITLGGAISVSSSIWWEKIEVDCVDADRNIPHDDDLIVMSSSDGNSTTANGHPELRAVLWVQQEQTKAKGVPFLEVNVVNVIPLDVKDAECHSLRVTACIAGVRLGGGMRYTESLLLRFGVLGPDGRLGNGLSRGLENLSSGPLSKIFKASPLNVNSIKENGISGSTQDNLFSHLGTPDDVDVSVVFRDWLFALEGAEEMVEEHAIDLLSREERCWHATFKSLQVKAKNSLKGLINGSMKSHGSPHYPVDSIVIGIEGLETLKPQVQTGSSKEEFPINGFEQKALGGVNVEVRMAISEYDTHDEIGKWTMENLKLSVHRPIEAVITKDELQHLTALCKSELDSMGRITAGVLRLLKLEGSFGQAAIDQLSNLGSEGLDRILTPKKLNNRSSGSVSNLQVTPSTNGIVKSLPAPPISDLVASLVDKVRDSQAKCDALISDLGKLHSSTYHVESARLLAEKLASMESLLSQLRTQS